MTVPSYTEDLTDISLADEATGWVELTGTDQDSEAYNANGSPAYEDNEYPYIQGLYAVTQDTTKSTSVGSLAYSSGGITIPTDGAVFLWHNYSSPFAMGTYAQGGYRICMGSGLGDFDVWYVGGSDKDNNPYGGWVNHVVNDTVTRDNWAGTSTSIDYVGSAISVISGPSKGEPHQCDAIRYGRGSAIFEHGEAADYCNIAGFAALNDAQAARWGLIQITSGGYLWKGRMQLGSVTNPVDFRDEGVTIFIQWTPKVTSNFNTIDIVNASSNIEMTGYKFIVLDPSGTASKGRWITTDNATVLLTTCVFNDMNTFAFGSNSTLIGTTFNKCGQITHGAATFDACSMIGYEGTVDTSYLVYNIAADIDGEIDDCIFTKGTAATHAIEFGTTANTTHSLRGIKFTGYNAANAQTDSTLYFADKGSDTDWTINLIGCIGNITYKTERVTDTVTLVSDPVTTLVTVTDIDGNPIETAKVALFAKDATGLFPYQESVTIVNASTLATVAHTAHGMATSDKTLIQGASHQDNNGVHTITVTSVDEYTYTMSAAPGSSPTGTIISTWTALYGDSDVDGKISMSRVIASDQPVVGWARKSTTSPFYITGILNGEILAASGVSLTALMLSDE